MGGIWQRELNTVDGCVGSRQGPARRQTFWRELVTLNNEGHAIDLLKVISPRQNANAESSWWENSRKSERSENQWRSGRADLLANLRAVELDFLQHSAPSLCLHAFYHDCSSLSIAINGFDSLGLQIIGARYCFAASKSWLEER